jgi:Predicted periplasmic protein
MKILFLSFAVTFLFSLSDTKRAAENGRIEITVSYERQAGPGSNQYAIWFENAQGQLVKTLFVTNYTAQGGYEIRPDCTPMWVGKANPASLSKEEVDAFSGATPQTGDHIYTWDLTDDKGNPVTAGEYTFYFEATLLGKSKVIYKDVISVRGKEVSINPKPEFSSEETQNKGMIKSVKATYLPSN